MKQVEKTNYFKPQILLMCLRQGPFCLNNYAVACVVLKLVHVMTEYWKEVEELLRVRLLAKNSAKRVNIRELNEKGLVSVV